MLTFYKNPFQVKKIQAVSTCMNICSQFYQYCYGTDDSFNLNQEQIILPLKAYISDFVVQMVIIQMIYMNEDYFKNLKIIFRWLAFQLLF